MTLATFDLSFLTVIHTHTRTHVRTPERIPSGVRSLTSGKITLNIHSNAVCCRVAVSGLCLLHVVEG